MIWRPIFLACSLTSPYRPLLRLLFFKMNANTMSHGQTDVHLDSLGSCRSQKFPRHCRYIICGCLLQALWKPFGTAAMFNVVRSRKLHKMCTGEGQAGPRILILHIIYSLIFHIGTFPIYFSTNNKGKKYCRKYITKNGYNITFC